MVQQVLTHFNGVVFFNPMAIFGTLEIDTCLQGLGVRYKNQVYQVTSSESHYNICHLEMLNVLVHLWYGQTTLKIGK